MESGEVVGYMLMIRSSYIHGVTISRESHKLSQGLFFILTQGYIY